MDRRVRGGSEGPWWIGGSVVDRRVVDLRVAGSMPDSTNFLTNSSGQATKVLTFCIHKEK